MDTAFHHVPNPTLHLPYRSWIARLRGCIRHAGALAILLGCFGSAGSAEEQPYEETERRLKTAGIDAALRVKIHAAIDRGVTWLLARQEASGAWDSTGGPSFQKGTPWPYPWPEIWSNGMTALAGLALQHAGSPRADEGAAKALEHLTHAASRSRDGIHVYVAGPTVLLCHARGQRKLGVAHATWIAQYLGSRSGMWGYGSAKRAAFVATMPHNLSTSQFACLGLWGGERLGMPLPVDVWRRHLTWLLTRQLADGSWPYRQAATPWVSAYPTGAFMGLANLLLAKNALRHELSKDEGLRERVLTAESRGRSAVRRFVRWKLRGLTAVTKWEALFPLYGLYALEKAAVFADVETLGSMRWYYEGAKKLIAIQDPNGSWESHRWLEGDVPSRHSAMYHGTRVLGTTFALLFLLRMSEAHKPQPDLRPTTGPAAKRPEPTTPESVSTASERVVAAEKALRDPIATSATIIARLTQAHGSYPNSDDGESALATRIEALLLEALELGNPRAKPGRIGQPRVAVHAARLLSRVGPRVVSGVQTFLKTHALGRGRIRLGVDLIEACLDVLSAHANAETLQWIIDRVVAPNEPGRTYVRTVTALTALQGYDKLPRAVRLRAAQRLLRRFTRLEAAKRNPAYAYWIQMRPDVVIALHDLAREDVGAGDLAVRRGASLKEFSEAIARLQ